MNNDIALIGLFIGFAGTFLWAKSSIFKKEKQTILEASSFYGANTPKVKSDLMQKFETGLGVVLIGFGFVLQAISIYIQMYLPNSQSLFPGEIYRIIFLFLLLIFLIVICEKISYFLGFKAFLSSVAESLFDAYKIHIFILNHGGIPEDSYTKGVSPAEDQKKKYLEQTNRVLFQLCEWFDIKRKNGEIDSSLFKRLGDLLEKTSRPASK